ncbi:hypothetical protein KC329_g16039 [Hortaea werneckii]|nr:hypothetical protein KC329_g16039 [Hortaea werneckii]
MSTRHGIPEEDYSKHVTVSVNDDGVHEMRMSQQFQQEMNEELLALSKQAFINGEPNPLFGFADRIPDHYKNARGPFTLEIGGESGSRVHNDQAASGNHPSAGPSSVPEKKDLATRSHPYGSTRIGNPNWVDEANGRTFEVLPNSNCNRDCVECMPQFCTAEDKRQVINVSNANAKEKAKKLATQAEQDRQYLQVKLQQYGDAVKKKWEKLSRERRRALMLAAQPSLYQDKWPELRSMFGYDQKAFGSHEEVLVDVQDTKKLQELAARDEKFRNGYMVPYLNLETLMDDRNKVLSLLHYRSANKLEDWVMFDSAQAKRAVEGGNLSREYNENCVIMFGERYGDLVKWHRAQCHRWNLIGYPRAIIVLETQALLLGFLRRLVDGIVPPSSTAMAGNAEWTLLASRGFRAANQTECWSPLANQAFSAPPALEPADVSKKVRAQLQAAQDHLRFLQTDPAYFHRYIAMQRKGEHFIHMSSDDISTSIASFAVVLPIDHVRHLQQLLEECEYVQRVHDQYKSSIELGGVLPNVYERAVGALEIFVINLYHAERYLLAEMLPRSPGFHRNHKYVKPPEGHTISKIRLRKTDCTPNETNEACYSDDPLLFAMYNLCGDPEDNRLFSIPFLMSFIEDLLARGTAEQHARIDQALYDQIGRMSVYGEILVNLRLTRPLSEPMWLENINEDYKQRAAWRTWMCTPAKPDAVENKKLAGLLEAFYKRPMPVGKKDAEWLTKAAESRKYMADFWAYARQVRRSKVTGIGLSDSDSEADVALFAADQSEEYLREVRAEEDMVRKAIAAAAAAKVGLQEDAPFQSQWDGNEGNNKSVLPVGRIKPKTRPEHEQFTNDPVRPVDDDAQDEGGKACIPVNSESLRIFARIFPNTTELAFKGVVQWKQFVTAMTDAECSATHTGGSAVSFERKARDGADGTIVFHKPHPDTEMDNMMLRMMGKRLKKWFGWDEGTFVERAKVASK